MAEQERNERTEERVRGKPGGPGSRKEEQVPPRQREDASRGTDRFSGTARTAPTGDEDLSEAKRPDPERIPDIEKAERGQRNVD